MSEREFDVRTYRVDYCCDECKTGTMAPTGLMLTSSPPQFPHKCTHCGILKTFLCRYPEIRHRFKDGYGIFHPLDQRGELQGAAK